MASPGTKSPDLCLNRAYVDRPAGLRSASRRHRNRPRRHDRAPHGGRAHTVGLCDLTAGELGQQRHARRTAPRGRGRGAKCSAPRGARIWAGPTAASQKHRTAHAVGRRPHPPPSAARDRACPTGRTGIPIMWPRSRGADRRGVSSGLRRYDTGRWRRGGPTGSATTSSTTPRRRRSSSTSRRTTTEARGAGVLSQPVRARGRGRRVEHAADGVDRSVSSLKAATRSSARRPASPFAEGVIVREPVVRASASARTRQ